MLLVLDADEHTKADDDHQHQADETLSQGPVAVAVLAWLLKVGKSLAIPLTGHLLFGLGKPLVADEVGLADF